MHRPSPVHVVIAALVVMGGALEVVAPATLAGPDHKTFAESVTYGSTTSSTTLPIAAGPFTLHFTIENTSQGRQAVPYGSFQMQIPSGITVTDAQLATGSPSNFNTPALAPTSAPTTITVTSNGPTGSGIQPTSSLTIDVVGTAASGVCPGTWNTFVKQSNDFSGSGNDFTGNSVSTPVAGGTQLVWTTQPTDTQYNVNMSPNPQVTLEDACGNGINITGTLTVTDSAGKMTGSSVSVSGAVATVSGVQFTDYGITDTLVATLGSVTGTSQTFTIYQFRKVCGSSGTCSTGGNLSGPNGKTLANVSADSASTTDVLTVNVKGDATGTCGGTTTEPPIGEVVNVNIDNRGKTVTMTLPKTYVLQDPNNGTPFMDICLDVTALTTTCPNAACFFDKRHYADPVTYPDPVTIGLIADCTVTGNVRPCVQSRKKNAGNEIIQMLLPAGDPNLIWH